MRLEDEAHGNNSHVDLQQQDLSIHLGSPVSGMAWSGRGGPANPDQPPHANNYDHSDLVATWAGSCPYCPIASLSPSAAMDLHMPDPRELKAAGWCRDSQPLHESMRPWPYQLLSLKVPYLLVPRMTQTTLRSDMHRKTVANGSAGFRCPPVVVLLLPASDPRVGCRNVWCGSVHVIKRSTTHHRTFYMVQFS